MSIYSGFATRQQEHHYNRLVEGLIGVLMKRCLKFYNGSTCDEQIFQNVLQKLVRTMIYMEQNKYLPPKFSKKVMQLTDYLGLDCTLDINALQNLQNGQITGKSPPGNTLTNFSIFYDKSKDIDKDSSFEKTEKSLYYESKDIQPNRSRSQSREEQTPKKARDLFEDTFNKKSQKELSSLKQSLKNQHQIKVRRLCSAKATKEQIKLKEKKKQMPTIDDFSFPKNSQFVISPQDLTKPQTLNNTFILKQDESTTQTGTIKNKDSDETLTDFKNSLTIKKQYKNYQEDNNNQDNIISRIINSPINQQSIKPINSSLVKRNPILKTHLNEYVSLHSPIKQHEWDGFFKSHFSIKDRSQSNIQNKDKMRKTLRIKNGFISVDKGGQRRKLNTTTDAQ